MAKKLKIVDSKGRLMRYEGRDMVYDLDKPAVMVLLKKRELKVLCG